MDSLSTLPDVSGIGRTEDGETYFTSVKDTTKEGLFCAVYSKTVIRPLTEDSTLVSDRSLGRGDTSTTSKDRLLPDT